jgi:hypothetical protein
VLEGTQSSLQARGEGATLPQVQGSTTRPTQEAHLAEHAPCVVPEELCAEQASSGGAEAPLLKGTSLAAVQQQPLRSANLPAHVVNVLSALPEARAQPLAGFSIESGCCAGEMQPAPQAAGAQEALSASEVLPAPLAHDVSACAVPPESQVQAAAEAQPTLPLELQQVQAAAEAEPTMLAAEMSAIPSADVMEAFAASTDAQPTPFVVEKQPVPIVDQEALLGVPEQQAPLYEEAVAAPDGGISPWPLQALPASHESGGGLPSCRRPQAAKALLVEDVCLATPAPPTAAPPSIPWEWLDPPPAAIRSPTPSSAASKPPSGPAATLQPAPMSPITHAAHYECFQNPGPPTAVAQRPVFYPAVISLQHAFLRRRGLGQWATYVPLHHRPVDYDFALRQWLLSARNEHSRGLVAQLTIMEAIESILNIFENLLLEHHGWESATLDVFRRMKSVVFADKARWHLRRITDIRYYRGEKHSVDDAVLAWAMQGVHFAQDPGTRRWSLAQRAPCYEVTRWEETAAQAWAEQSCQESSRGRRDEVQWPTLCLLHGTYHFAVCAVCRS